MKKTKRLWIVVVAVVCLFMVTACTAPDLKGQSQPDAFYGEWMSYIKDDTLIKKIAIPGSHDAGSVSMAKVGSTQNTTIKTQLESGVRYFDIRVEKSKDKLIIFHDIIKGVEFLPILSDIYEFIKAHPTEFIILDFQHFANDSQGDVIAAIEDVGLDDYAVKKKEGVSALDYIDSLTMSDVRGKALITYGDRTNAYDQDYIFIRNNDGGDVEGCVFDSYYNGEYHKNGVDNLIEKGVPDYFAKYAKKNKGLWCLQLQPGSKKMISNLYKNEREFSPKVNEFISKIAETAELLNSVNVIIRDLVTEEELGKIKAVLSLNTAKGFILDREDKFESMT